MRRVVTLIETHIGGVTPNFGTVGEKRRRLEALFEK
jgi:hypothetical protein